jgi:acid stress chaperone HdeB
MQVCKPMEVTVKLRLLLASTLFLFAQMSTMQAQETLDLAKITCEQFTAEQLATPSRDIVLLLAGYYNGKRNNTIIEPQKIKQEDEKVKSYCSQHRETPLMDAVKNVLGFDK